jgi:hypothetical protein
MRRAIPITEQFQPFVVELKESLWGDLYGLTKAVWKKTLEEESARLKVSLDRGARMS